MSENSINNSEQSLVIPAFRNASQLNLELTKTKEATSRLIESKTVNPVTYVELEYCYGEAYRELKRHIASIGHEIAKTEVALRMAKSIVLREKYPQFMEGRPKSQDNSDMRDAFLIQDKEYLEALERLNLLKAMEAYVDGKIKTFENASRWMKKQMDLIIRSGLSNQNLYITNKGR